MVQDGHSDEVITAYLNSGTTGHSTWMANESTQGNSDVILRSARLLDSQTGEPALVTDFDKPLRIEIEYDVLRMCRNLSMGIRIADAQGHLLFSSRDTDTTEWKGQSRDAGSYISRCHLPDYLKPGRYYLSITASEGARKVGFFENVLVFDVSGVGCKFSPQRRGLITPLLGWDVIHRRIAAAISHADIKNTAIF